VHVPRVGLGPTARQVQKNLPGSQIII